MNRVRRLPLLLCALSPSLLPGARAASEPLAGSVVQVAADAVYLDRGSRDGLALGAQVELAAAGGEHRRLQVMRIADHHAAAVPPSGWEVRAGEAWIAPGVERTHAAPDPVRGPLPPASPDPAALELGWAEALRRPFALLTRAPEPASRGVAASANRLRIVPAGWARHGASTRVYHLAEATLRFSSRPGRDGGARFGVELDLAGWSGRPEGDRARPRGDPALRVRELCAGLAPRAGGVAVRAGRFRPPFAPGTWLLDGAQVSWEPGRPEGEAPFAAGVRAGFVPHPFTLAPSAARRVAGAFVSGALPLAGSARAAASLRGDAVRVRDGVNRAEAELRCEVRTTGGLALEAAALLWHEGAGDKLAHARGELRRDRGGGSWRLSHRESERSLDAIERAALGDALGTAAAAEDRVRRTELALARQLADRGRLSAELGRAGGEAGFERWTVDAGYAHSGRLWRLDRLRAGYRGSFGWQEGHEALFAARLPAGGWEFDFSAGGGVRRQARAERVTPVGRGALGVGRELPGDSRARLTLYGTASRRTWGGTGRLDVSLLF